MSASKKSKRFEQRIDVRHKIDVGPEGSAAWFKALAAQLTRAVVILHQRSIPKRGTTDLTPAWRARDLLRAHDVVLALAMEAGAVVATPLRAWVYRQKGKKGGARP